MNIQAGVLFCPVRRIEKKLTAEEPGFAKAVPGDSVANGRPLASIACFSGVSGGKCCSHAGQYFGSQMDIGVLIYGLTEQVGESFSSEAIAFGYAGIAAMACRVGEERRADVVGREDDFDGLGSRRDKAGDAVEVGDKFGRISLAREGEHAEKMMRAEADRHGLRILSFEFIAVDDEFGIGSRAELVQVHAEAFAIRCSAKADDSFVEQPIQTVDDRKHQANERADTDKLGKQLSGGQIAEHAERKQSP